MRKVRSTTKHATRRRSTRCNSQKPSMNMSARRATRLDWRKVRFEGVADLVLEKVELVPQYDTFIKPLFDFYFADEPTSSDGDSSEFSRITTCVPKLLSVIQRQGEAAAVSDLCNHVMQVGGGFIDIMGSNEI